jgi:hypothetical protein
MTANTNPTNPAGPAGGDIFARWGVWIAIATLAVTSIGLIIAIVAIWVGGNSSTNARIDAIYPSMQHQSDLIQQQTELVDKQTHDLDTIQATLTAAQAAITAAANQNTDLTKQMVSLQERQAALLTRQEDQITNIQDIKKAINDMSSNLTSRLDQLQNRIDKINFPLPVRKTDFFEGSYVFASPKILEKFGSEFKEFGATSVIFNLDGARESNRSMEGNPGQGQLFLVNKGSDCGQGIDESVGTRAPLVVFCA